MLIPVARPLLLIVATLVALLAQVKVVPLIVLPLLSLAVAVNCCVAPWLIEGVDGETAIVATVPDEPFLLELPPHATSDNKSVASTGNGQRNFTRISSFSLARRIPRGVYARAREPRSISFGLICYEF